LTNQTGGHLGIYCQYAYAHTHSDNAHAFPGILKGADMAVYTVFSALGLRIQVRAILDKDTTEFNNYLENHEENFFGDHLEEEEDAYELPPLATHTVVGTLGGHGFAEDLGGARDDYEDVVSAWSRDWRKVVWVNGPRQSDLDMVHMTVSFPLHRAGWELTVTVWQRGWHRGVVLACCNPC
jgi:hypothetical protein